MFSGKNNCSDMRKLYIKKLFLRGIAFIFSLIISFAAPEQFDIIYGMNFFKKFYLFHFLWLFWIINMVLYLIPLRKYLPIGSQKYLKSSFCPAENYNCEELSSFIKSSRRGALKTAAAWIMLISVIGILYFTKVITAPILLLISIAFFVCDDICILFWCPFRAFFMKNRCCTTCRIYNWDHAMMFSPLIFIKGFFSISLCVSSLIIFLAWEICFALHPERFWEGSNIALKCQNCTDRLCGKKQLEYNIKK